MIGSHKRVSLPRAATYWSQSNRAFTLIELLLVLSIIVALLGLGVPLVQRMYAKNRLKSTTQELQTLLYRTRQNAMKTGKAVVFRYRYGSPVYEILPKEVFDQRKKSETGAEAFMIGSEMLDTEMTEEGGPTETEIPADVWQAMLPHDIVFGDIRQEETTETETAMISSEAVDDSISGAALSFNDGFSDVYDSADDNDGSLAKTVDDGWSPPILFFPNGRTSQTVLELRTTGRYDYKERLFLRALTGTAGIVEE